MAVPLSPLRGGKSGCPWESLGGCGGFANLGRKSPEPSTAARWIRLKVLNASYPVKRLQIYIEEEMDDALAVEAGRRRTSKAALIREVVAERYGGGQREDDDPMRVLIGAYDSEPADIDELVYGR